MSLVDYTIGLAVLGIAAAAVLAWRGERKRARLRDYSPEPLKPRFP